MAERIEGVQATLPEELREAYSNLKPHERERIDLALAGVDTARADLEEAMKEVGLVARRQASLPIDAPTQEQRIGADSLF